MTLTKDDLVNSLNSRLDLPKRKASTLVEAVLDIIKGSLEREEDVLVSGFGKFCVKRKKERRGRNPATGDDLILGSRKVLVFKCSGVLRDKVNGKGEN
jgi:integration host factor subunit alpha